MGWKPEKKRLSDQVTEQLKWLILEGRYAPGQRLPSERALAEELGVTRLTLREALKATEAAGFTTTRHGDGTYACDVWENATLQILGELLSSDQRLSARHIRSLLEFRMVVCQGFSQPIAQNATAEHIEGLKAIVVRERAMLDDLDGLIASDHEFLGVLAKASGNLIFSLLIQSVRPAYLYLSRIVFESIDSLERIVDAHSAIIRAIEAHDGTLLFRELTTFVGGGNAIIESTLARDESKISEIT